MLLNFITTSCVFTSFHDTKFTQVSIVWQKNVLHTNKFAKVLKWKLSKAGGVINCYNWHFFAMLFSLDNKPAEAVEIERYCQPLLFNQLTGIFFYFILENI